MNTLDRSYFFILNYALNCFVSVMISMLASIAIDRGFEPWSDLNKDC